MLTDKPQEKDTHKKSKWSWIGNGAEFLSIFIALALLTGRVSVQSYWNQYGLSLDIANTNIVNYAVASPNTTLASIIISLSIVAFIWFIQQKDLHLTNSPNISQTICLGFTLFFIGVSVVMIFTFYNFPTLVYGLAGIFLGSGFITFITGIIVIGEATQQKWKEKTTIILEIYKIYQDQIWYKRNFVYKFWQTHIVSSGKRFCYWCKTRNNKTIIKPPSTKINPTNNINYFFGLRVLLAFLFIIASLWAILDSAYNFGIADVYSDYANKPWVSVQLDSSIGLEDMMDILSANNVLENVKIITEVGDFLYFSSNETFPLVVYVIPISRVQTIQYTSKITK